MLLTSAYVDVTSIENNTPPTGPPKVTAKPAAQPAADGNRKHKIFHRLMQIYASETYPSFETEAPRFYVTY